ncbi:Fe-S cluster assembly scaffold SufA [Prosthecomicrobium hirschii]|uniref:Fe-S cluster assembly scaffold SufA n=1 Tax=Prosthecodimorpha hirschii TaxID=665126 RepID=UPI00112A9152|nr:Fe-S cluster assembly scaffold SufA [Prosthecomicrobium hirschii]TPQ50782.1 Fe-S cluster assembly scaffold SufA [Prosthecomicrobium hirschii]
MFGLKVISLTDAAAERVKEIMSGSERPIQGLRLGVKKGGCAGMSYTMDYVETPDPKDDVVDEKGVRVFVDPKAALFLLGTTMDFETSKLSSGFVFRNPNEVSACGCGESVELKPAEIAGTH